MKLKTFLMLLLVMGVLAGAAFYLYFNDTIDNRSQQAGEKLIDALPLEKVSKIIITSNQEIIRLKKEDALWVLENRFGYLADFSAITNLVLRLKETIICRSFKASEDAVLRLGLTLPDPDSGNTEAESVGIEIRDFKDTVLAQVILGVTRAKAVGSGDGNYVMFPKGDLIFLVDKHFNDVGKTSNDWIKENIIDVDKEEIQKIACFNADGSPVYTLVRPEKGEWPAFEGITLEAALNLSRLDDIITPLSPMSILGVETDSVHSTIPDSVFPQYFEYTLYDGSLFKLAPGKYVHDSGKVIYLLKAQQLKGPDQAPDQPTEPIDGVMQNWIYQIPKWKYERFIPKVEMYLKN